MAINFTDFSRAPLLDSPAASIFEDVLKGYKMSKEPAKMAEEQKQRVLGNQLKELEVKHKPTEYQLSDQGKKLANALHSKALEHYEEKFQLEKQHKQAQIAKLTQKGLNAGMKLNGAVANAEAIYQLKQDPNADPAHIKALETAFNVGQEHTELITKRSKDVIAGNSFDKLPTNDKKQAVALMKGMGADPVASVQWLRSGKSPTDYANEHGVDISTVEPDYALGEQNIKMAQQAASNMDELDSLEKHITGGLGEYQNKIMGYSMEQIKDALDGTNPEKQGKALAARALLPELSALRLKIAGGNIGIEALREMEHKSLGQMKVFESLVDKKVYKEAQKYMKDWINEAGKVRIKSLNKFSMLKTRLQKGAEAESGMGNDPLGLR